MKVFYLSIKISYFSCDQERGMVEEIFNVSFCINVGPVVRRKCGYFCCCTRKISFLLIAHCSNSPWCLPLCEIYLTR